MQRVVRPPAADLLLAVAIAALALADVFAELSNPIGTAAPRTAVLPVLVIAGALAFRRLYPVGTTLVVAAAVVLPALAFTVRLVYWGDFMPWLFALATVGRNSPVRRGLVALGISLLAFTALLPTYADLAEPGNVVYDLGLMVVFWFGGLVFHNRAMLRRENIRLDKDRRLAGERAIATERARIARELHDVISHGIGIIVLQAGGARLGFDQDPDEARRALGRIETIGRDSLTELRLLLEVLRHDELADPADGSHPVVAPQPTVRRLVDLVEETRGLGVPVQLDLDPRATDLPMGLQLSTYRIVQEALTNVLKHAGSVATSVRVECSGCLAIEVTNAAGRGDTSSPSGGHGLLGIAERVSVLGGELRARPTPEGGFRLQAEIPLDREVG